MDKYIQEAKHLLILAFPAFIAQVTQTAFGFVDTVMAGKVSATDMAAVAVAGAIFLPIILFGQGLLQALIPIIAQLNGASERNKIAHQFWQGFWLSLLLCVPIISILCCSDCLITKISYLDPKLAQLTIRYLKAISWGVPGYLLYLVIRCLCEGISKTIPGMIVSFVGLIVNILVNPIFIYGYWGFQPLGGVGCGVATAIVYWVLLLLSIFYLLFSSTKRDLQLFKQFESPNLKTLLHLVKLGLPIGFSYFFEITLFAVAALLIAPLGSTVVAGHQVALNFSSLIFMLPFSVSIAVTIRIGYRLGQRSPDQAKIVAHTALIFSLLIGIASAITTTLMRDKIAAIYSSDPTVLRVAVKLILFAAVFQCADSLQVVTNGILRGYKDTFAIFTITFIAYWWLGLSCGYVLGLTDLIVPAMGASGMWYGFIIGITSAAIMLIVRMHRLQQLNHDTILKIAQR